MNAPLQGHTVSKPITTAQALLSVDQVSLEYRTPARVVRATHQVSFEIDPADRFCAARPFRLRQVDIAQVGRRVHPAL